MIHRPLFIKFKAARKIYENCRQQSQTPARLNHAMTAAAALSYGQCGKCADQTYLNHCIRLYQFRYLPCYKQESIKMQAAMDFCVAIATGTQTYLNHYIHL